MHTPRIMIAAPKSGSGKTLITCALLRALKKRERRIKAFKCGPDYIDPMFHRQIIGVDSRNLDCYFSDEEQIRALFLRDGEEGELSVIEGVMGLYDGLGGIREEASSYHLAQILQAPIVLTVDARGMGRSILPLLRGFLQYDRAGLIKGVILNRAGKGLCELLAPLIEEELGLTVLGYVSERRELSLESRHLGLKLPGETGRLCEQVELAAGLLEEGVDVNRLLELAENAPELPEPAFSPSARKLPKAVSPPSARKLPRGAFVSPAVSEKAVRIGVARDEAFCFYYEENLNLLREAGAELVFFSPLHDERLPGGLHGILLGGGYPELWAEQLCANRSMRRSVREAIARNMPSVAECGGFLYLHEYLSDREGRRYEMCGVIPAECRDTGRLVRFGYVEIAEKSPLFLREGGIRGHEFHYFDSTDNGESCVACKPVSGKTWECVHEGANHWWGFAHLYYPSNPVFAKHFLEAALQYKNCLLHQNMS